MKRWDIKFLVALGEVAHESNSNLSRNFCSTTSQNFIEKTNLSWCFIQNWYNNDIITGTLDNSITTGFKAVKIKDDV